MMSDLKYWVWLSALTDVSLNSIASLLEHFGSAEKAFDSAPGSFRKVEGISSKDAEKLEDRSLERAEAIISMCRKEGIKIIPLDSEEYPSRLKDIYAPPVVLYVRGTLPDLENSAPIAVIGTRKASEYGLRMGRNMAYELSKCGAPVISLLTAGIDAAAAEGALLAEGPVVGVLGIPIDNAGSKLARAVERNGALVSEYPPAAEQQRFFFRARNRIASGLSCGVVVIEAPEKSGTRLFVAEALEQGREVYALPSNADSETGSGTLRLLREGARLAVHGWHIAEDFPEYLDSSIHEEFPEEKPEIEQDEEKFPIDNEKTPCYIDLKLFSGVLSDDQEKIASFINGNVRHADEIIENTGLPASAVLAELTVLEIMGIVRRTPDGGFEISG